VLPVEGEGGRLVGVVGLRELARLSGQIGDGYSAARTARPEDEMMSLLPVFTEAEVRAVVIVNADRQIVGLVTQTDLLNAIAHGAVANDSRPAGSAAA
jgi:CBS domain-containing membrane protein